jgi:uncharacterized membrane protein YeiB
MMQVASMLSRLRLRMKVGFAGDPGCCRTVLAQVAMSRWWLSRFRMGPLEWIWRCVTYWRLQPLRIESPVLVARRAA